MVARDKFIDTEYDKLLRLISVVSFRYNIIGSRQANAMEDLYNMVSVKIFNNLIQNTSQVFNEIKSLYVSDNDFKNDFSTITLYSYGRDKKLVRYILFEIENHLQQGGDNDFEYNPATIEHILPENPPVQWDKYFPPVLQEAYIYRLGNYTLLEDHLNNECGDSLLETKKISYAKSQYMISKKILVDEWTPTTLDLRQQEMSRWATACWRVPYADAK